MNFISEFKLRWSANSQPKFFQLLQNIGLILGFIGGIPALAVQYGFVIPIPQTILVICAVSGFTSYLISKLTVDTQTKQALNIS